MSDYRDYLNKRMKDESFKKEWDEQNLLFRHLRGLADGMNMILKLEFVPKQTRV